jgi:hypothetical protein
MSDEIPTIDSPASGYAFSVINNRKHLLSEVVYWSDGDQVIVRSREFDCFAEGRDLDDALEAFREQVLAYAENLQEREDSGTATEHELEINRLLSKRLSRIFLEERRQGRRGLLRRHRPGENRIGRTKVTA